MLKETKSEQRGSIQRIHRIKMNNLRKKIYDFPDLKKIPIEQQNPEKLNQVQP